MTLKKEKKTMSEATDQATNQATEQNAEDQAQKGTDQATEQNAEDQAQKEEKSTSKMFSRDEVAKMVNAQMEQYKKEQSMTEEEREQERIKALAEKEEALRIRETTIEVTGELQEAGLPTSLASLIAKEPDDEERSNIITGLKSTFSQAVDKAVDKALQGKTELKSGTSTDKGLTAEDIMAEPDMDKRQKLINDNIHLFK